MESVYRPTLRDKIEYLVHANTVFRKLLSPECLLTPEERAEATRVFNDLYPEDDFDQFMQQATSGETPCDEEGGEDDFLEDRTEPSSVGPERGGKSLCGSTTFDPQLNRHYKLEISTVGRKKKNEEFDPVQFLRRAEERAYGFPMTIDVDETYDDSYDDKKQKAIVADACLRKVETFVKILAQTQDVHLLDVRGENRVN